MNIRKFLLPIVLALPLAMVGSLTPRTGWAALDIADVPLFAASVVEPNIQFILDDSGSMRWGFMPDDLIDEITSGRHINVQYCNYRGSVSDGNYLDYAGANDTCALKSDGMRYLVSSHLNNVYFNPATDYSPPLKPDGTAYPDASFDWAKWNGYNATACTSTNGRCINLGSNYRAIMDPYYYYGRTGSAGSSRNRYGFVISPDAEGGDAFYYTFNGATGCDSNPYKDACYDYNKVSNSQKQNFANWFSYYRTREMLAKAGISSAFHQQGNRIRVGYGSINNNAVERGVRKFEGSDRVEFFEWLRDQNATGSTPLRNALKNVGEYYKNKKEPWRTDPTDTSENWSDMLACRQSYSILMTDGYWGGDSPGVGDVDEDGHSNTLADVAREYWDTDLVDQLENKVPLKSNQRQHMITFGVGLGVTGTIADTNAALEWAPNDSRWPNPTTADAHKIDDLLHAAANSHGGFFSASDPQAFADELARTLGKIATAAGAAFGLTSSGIVQKIGGLGFQVDTDTGNWTSEIYGIVDPGTSGERIKWRVSNKMPAHSSRKLFTNTGGTSGAAFNGTVGGLDALLVSYIRGDSALEGTTYQKRDSLVGAIVGSQPFLQRQVNYDWTRLPSAQGGGKTYEDYVEGKASKPSVLYAGSNAGVLHAFSAQSGVEMFGYVPRGVWDRLSDLANPDVPFRFTVDGEVVVTDAYNGTAWKTVLVGGLGAGGKAIYALDVTNPGSFSASNVMWEVTAADLASDSKAEPSDLGFTFAKPQVARLKNGTWAVVVGNGYGADDHQARLLVLDLFSGKVIGNIQAGGSGTEANPNGLSSPRVVRERPEETYDRWVYAGDLHGNLWRFDLNSIGSTTSISKPFFSGAKNGNRPITAQPQTSYPGAAGFAVSFGTGKFFEANDSVVDDLSPAEYFFFIYDNNPTGTAPEYDLTDLANRSFTGATTGEQDEIEVGGNDKGWYIKFQDRGERLLSQPRVLPGGLGMVTFTSFVPTQDRCEPGGDNWLYLLRTESGQGALAGQGLDGTSYADTAGRDGGIKGPPTQPVVRVKPPVSGEDDQPPEPPPICISIGDREICLDSEELEEAAMDMYYGRRANWIQVR